VIDLSDGEWLDNLPLDGWSQWIRRVLGARRISFLSRQLSKRRFDLGVGDLPALGLQLLEQLEASELHAEADAGPVMDLPAPDLPVSGLPVSGLPVSGLPVSGLPVSGLPVSGLPVSGLPVSDLPALHLPAADAAADAAADWPDDGTEFDSPWSAGRGFCGSADPRPAGPQPGD